MCSILNNKNVYIVKEGEDERGRNGKDCSFLQYDATSLFDASCERAQAQDIVQNVFMKYMEKQPDFIDEEHEKAWLLRVASNMCKDYLGHWWNRKRNHLTVNDTQFIEKAKTTSSVLEEVRKLSFHQRNAVFLFYFEGYSMKEIAQIFHVKRRTVSWLTRARKQLKSKRKKRCYMMNRYQKEILRK